MNLHRILFVVLATSLALRCPVNAEELEPIGPVASRFYEQDGTSYSNESPRALLLAGMKAKADISGTLVDTQERAQPAGPNNELSQRKADLNSENSSKRVERKVSVSANHAGAARQSPDVTTHVASQQAPHDTLRIKDYSVRLSAVENAIKRVELGQESGLLATKVLGITLLGVFLHYLCGHWVLFEKADQWLRNLRATNSQDANVGQAAEKTTPIGRDPREPKSKLPSPPNKSLASELQSIDGGASSSSPSGRSARPEKQETEANSPTGTNTVSQDLPDVTPVDDYQEIPEPISAIRSLIHSINDLQPVNKLSLADERWCTGFARNIGPRENQHDYVIAFTVGRIQVCLLADGAGGHKLAEFASFWGILGGATSISRTLGFTPDDGELQLERTARQAIHDASFAIAIHAAKNGIPQRSSLRSTLIVLLATDEQFSWANLGDGGGWTVRATPRSYDSFLVPAKGEQQHHLASSLGPAIHGQITSGTKPWGDADFLAIASDGVADVIDTDPFFEVCLATCLQQQGDFSVAAEFMLQVLIESPDVSDNLSIGFVGRRRKPVLAG